MRHPKENEKARQAFQEQIAIYKTEKKEIVYIDESGFAKDMPRTHGYSYKGKRCFGIKDWNSKGRTNVIGALLHGVLLTTMLFDFNINSDIFHAWAKEDLLPKLPASSVIVMDNAAFHKRKDIQEIIVKSGHILLYLPPYSPDLNPIEHKWAQIKKKRQENNYKVENLFSGDL